jgi:hypothetical protein
VTVAKRATGQAFPEVDIALEGELRESTFTRSAPPRQLGERTTPFRNTFVVTKLGGFWIICGFHADPRTGFCVTAI